MTTDITTMNSENEQRQHQGAGYSKAGTYASEYPWGWYPYPPEMSEYPGVLAPTFQSISVHFGPFLDIFDLSTDHKT